MYPSIQSRSACNILVWGRGHSFLEKAQHKIQSIAGRLLERTAPKRLRENVKHVIVVDKITVCPPRNGRCVLHTRVGPTSYNNEVFQTTTKFDSARHCGWGPRHIPRALAFQGMCGTAEPSAAEQEAQRVQDIGGAPDWEDGRPFGS